MRDQLVTERLGYAGLIPFYGAVLGFAVFTDYPQSLSVQAFIVYSLAILCFLSGALWGQAGHAAGKEQILRRIVSNGIVLYAVAAVLLMLGFVCLLWYEHRLGDMALWYGRLRFRLTLGVVIAHIIYVGLHLRVG